MNSTLLFHIQSLLILSLLYVGVAYRKVTKVHVRIMASAIIWDILLILQIELSRGAIKKASAIFTNPIILNIHVSIATAVVVLYIIMIYLGRKMLSGDYTYRIWHKRTGYCTIILRTMTFITSFFAVSSGT